MKLPESTNIQKLLEVRKNLSGFLKTKYNNDVIFSVKDDRIPGMNCETENNCVLNTENNINARPSMFENKFNDKTLKIINYDDPYELSTPQKSMNYIVENKKEMNPFSEIDRYDNMIEKDKPFNYFSNYNYNTSVPSYQMNSDNFRKSDYTTKANLMKTEINEINNNLYNRLDNKFITNQSINYLEEIKNNKFDVPKGYPSSIKLEENYLFENRTKNHSLHVTAEQELLHKSIENKKNLRINTKPFPTGNNTTISNLTTIQSINSL
jgi:hypothetical protein